MHIKNSGATRVNVVLCIVAIVLVIIMTMLHLAANFRNCCFMHLCNNAALKWPSIIPARFLCIYSVIKYI